MSCLPLSPQNCGDRFSYISYQSYGANSLGRLWNDTSLTGRVAKTTLAVPALLVAFEIIKNVAVLIRNTLALGANAAIYGANRICALGSYLSQKVRPTETPVILIEDPELLTPREPLMREQEETIDTYWRPQAAHFAKCVAVGTLATCLLGGAAYLAGYSINPFGGVKPGNNTGNGTPPNPNQG